MARLTKKSGIYQIRNLVNDNIYIGSSVNFQSRRSKHFKELKENKHHSAYLQNSYNKHGLANFVFEILEEVKDSSLLLSREQAYMDSLLPEYNICKVAGSILGVKMSERVIQNNRNRQIGEKAHSAKLNWTEVREIRKKYNDEKITFQQLAKIYGVSVGCVEHILTNRTWTEKNYKHKKKKHTRSKLTWKEIKEIRKLYTEGMKIKQICVLFGYSLSCISLITRNITWKDDNYVPVPRTKGEKHYLSKLSYEKVRKIRKLREEHSVSLQQLAINYGCCVSTISNIINYKIWV